jgi:hypothetical protein
MRTLTFTLILIVTASCEKSKAPAQPEAAPVQAKKTEKIDTAGKAEVEFFGNWSAGEVKAASFVFVAQAEACLPVPEKPTRFGEQKLEKQGPLFAEFFIPQGTVGHACVYGLDEAGKVVSAANSTQNPMSFKGEGEVIFGKLDYALKAP